MKTANLFEICSPKQWKTISGNEILTEGKYPVYGANGVIGFYNKYNHEHETLLITCRGATCGTMNISVPQSYANGNAMALDDLSNEVDLKFLYYYLNVRGFNDVISGSAQPQITRVGLQNVTVNYPPLSEQKAIAEKLDKADALRKKDQQLLAKYDELAQSLFIDMFGEIDSNIKKWEIFEINNFCKIQGGYSFKSKDFISEGIKLVKISNVHTETLRWDECEYLPENFLNKHKQYRLFENDIVIALTRPIIKSLETVKIAKVQSSDLPLLLNQRVAKFNIYKKEQLNEVFLYHFCLTPYFKDKIAKYSSTSLQPNVSTNQIEEIKIFAPPLSLQTQFAEKIKNIESQKNLLKKQAKQSEDLFQALLQESFQ